MAKVKAGNIAPGALPLSRGNFIIQPSPHGLIAKKWPIKRGTPKTPYDFYKQKEFAYAAWYAANPFPLDLGTAIEMVKGSSLVPRDFLMLAAYGRAYEIRRQDGFVWPVYRDLAPNPQYVLDLITTTVGSLIWRAPEGWIPIDPPSVSYVLTGTVDGPAWQPLPNPYVPIDINELLDTITTTPGAILFRGVTDWVGLAPGTTGDTMVQGATGPEWTDTSDPSLLHDDASANLTVGFTSTAFAKGTVSSGTFTPNPADGNLQSYTNNGAHTLAPPSVGAGDSCQITVLSTNGSSASNPTVTAFTKVTGDAFTTTNGHKFLLYMTVIAGQSLLNRVALQ